MDKRKNFKYCMSLDYGIVTYKEKDGTEEYFVAEIPELKGCSAYGSTVEEAIEELKKAKQAWIKSALDDGEDIPLPEEYEEFSGKLILRINPRIHKKIAQVAKVEGVSLNTWLNKAIQAKLDIEQKTPEIQKEYEKLKQDILAELKAQVGGLRRLINETIVERQDIKAIYVGTEWGTPVAPVKSLAGMYTLVGSSAVQQFGAIVGQPRPVGTYDSQFTPSLKLEETG